MQQGKWVVIGIFVLAVAAATGAWFHQRGRGLKCLEYLGGPSASLIRFARKVEWFELIPAEELDANGLLGSVDLVRRIDDVPFEIRSLGPLTNEVGFVHARQALIEDRSYEWGPEGSDGRQDAGGTIAWNYLFQFRNDDEACELVLDESFQHLRLLDRAESLRLDATMREGLRTFVKQQLRPVAAAP